MTTSWQRARPAPSFKVLPIALLLNAIGAIAQEVPQPPAQKLERIEITTRPLSDTDLRRHSPVAKQIYGREELDKYGDTSVTDVLKRLPGVDIANGAPRLRGLGSGYTLILINGEPAPAGFQLEQLNPKLIDRIEINKSPTADLSTQAVAGVINIFLKDVPRVRQQDLRLRAGYRAERPVFGASWVWGQRIPGSVGISIPVSVSQWRSRTTTESDAVQLGVDQLLSEIHSQTLARNWGRSINTAPKLSWTIDEDQKLSVQAFINSNNWHFENTAENQILSGKPANVDDQNGTGHYELIRLGTTYTNRLDNDTKLELKLGGQSGRGKFRNGTFINGGIAQNNWLRDNFGKNSDKNITQSGKIGRAISDTQTVTLGWDVEHRRRERVSTTTLVTGGTQLPGIDGRPLTTEIDRQALFAQHEWELSPRVSTYLGLRNERLKTTSEGANVQSRTTTNHLAPLGHIQIKLDPKGKDVLRASLSSSFKTPDPISLMGRLTPNRLFPDLSRSNDPLSPDSIGNPGLRPETATGIDLAWERYLNNGGLVSVGVFSRRVKNLVRNQVELVSGLPGTSAPRWVDIPRNIGTARANGLEIEMKGRAGELWPNLFAATTPLTIRTGLNFYRSRVDNLPEPNNRLDGQQPWTLSLAMDYRAGKTVLGQTTLGASSTYIPGYTTQQDNNRRLRQGKSLTFDAYLSAQISPSTSMRLALQSLLPAISDRRSERSPQGFYTNQTSSSSTNVAFTLDMKL